jgi:hypothetical protein
LSQVAPGTALFLYTEDALNDVRASLIRPSVHCLSSEFNMNWDIEDDGTPYAAPQQVKVLVLKWDVCVD